MSETPDRTEVRERWRALVEGRLSRGEVHAWAVPWVEERFGGVADLMTHSGLQSLHGFDLTRDPERPSLVRHGTGGEYLHSEEDIAEALTRWERDCARFDADPVAFERDAIARARRYLAAEQRPDREP